MTPPQMADLLNLISSTDGRNLTQQMPSAWMDIIGDLDFQDSKAAVVRHFQESTEWLMPAHVRKGVRVIRDRRLVDAGPVLPNRADESQDNALKVAREITAAVASGRVSAEDFKRYRDSGLTFREWERRELAA